MPFVGTKLKTWDCQRKPFNLILRSQPCFSLVKKPRQSNLRLMSTLDFLLRIGMVAFCLFHETGGAFGEDKTSSGAAEASGPSQRAEDRAAAQTLAWLKHTVREPYDRVGKRDPWWDTAARKALDEYVLALRKNGDPDGSRLKAVGAAAHEAALAGCNDPLISYLDVRFGTERRLLS